MPVRSLCSPRAGMPIDHPVSCNPAALQRVLGLQLNFISMHISGKSEEILKKITLTEKFYLSKMKNKTPGSGFPLLTDLYELGSLTPAPWVSPMAFHQPQFPHLPSLGCSEEWPHESTHWHPLLNPLPRKLTSLPINLGLLTWTTSWRLCGMSCTRQTVHFRITRSFPPL